jgi:hypothetical protein
VSDGRREWLLPLSHATALEVVERVAPGCDAERQAELVGILTDEAWYERADQLA